MKEKKSTTLLRIVLIIYAIVCLVYGLCYFFVPDVLVNMSGGEPVYHGWLRWSGGVLIALGIGAILVYQNPKNQGIFVLSIAIGSALAGLALVYAWITIGEGANVWFTALPAIILLIISALLWWGKQQAKDILKVNQE